MFLPSPPPLSFSVRCRPEHPIFKIKKDTQTLSKKDVALTWLGSSCNDRARRGSNTRPLDLQSNALPTAPQAPGDVGEGLSATTFFAVCTPSREFLHHTTLPGTAKAVSVSRSPPPARLRSLFFRTLTTSDLVPSSSLNASAQALLRSTPIWPL